jgi:hypothetical protein
MVLKYFSSVVEQPINTGGRKLISDMQNTIKRFLTNEKIPFREYNFSSLRNSILLLFPSPYSKYLFFGYLGNPFFNFPLVVPYIFFFSLVAIKKRICKEKYYLISVDLMEWQSTVLSDRKKQESAEIVKTFQFILERILISHVADEVISLADKDFMIEHYKAKEIHELEFLDHYTDVKAPSESNVKKVRVLYVGDLGSRKGFDLGLFESIMKQSPDECEFWVVASGLDKNTESRLRSFQNLRLFEQQEIGQLNNIAKECHFGLILYSPEYLYYNIAPSIKLSFYISNGLTVISSNLKMTKKLNDKYNFGYVLERKNMLEFFKHLSSERIKRNEDLEMAIANGKFLYKALSKLDLE